MPASKKLTSVAADGGVDPTVIEPKKRAAPKKKATDPSDATEPKKKSSKPSKLVTKQTLVALAQETPPNIILHLKCSMSDLNEYNNKLRTYLSKPLEYNPEIPPEIESYDNSHIEYTEFDNESQQHTSRPAFSTLHQHVHSHRANGEDASDNRDMFDASPVDATSNKEINHKLKQMKLMLYKNSLQEEKKSACFWCTCDFDNAACRIPKYELDGTIHGYGSFCRPECGVAFLFREPLDDSTKFERYQLMNKIYGPVYKFKKNIKPAPDPYYLLDKFYGNMSIQEYRKLLKSDHLLLTIDKPLTRILPELHEDTDENILNIYGINKSAASSTTASGVYKVKRQSEKHSGPSKTSIIRDTFGL